MIFTVAPVNIVYILGSQFNASDYSRRKCIAVVHYGKFRRRDRRINTRVLVGRFGLCDREYALYHRVLAAWQTTLSNILGRVGKCWQAILYLPATLNHAWRLSPLLVGALRARKRFHFRARLGKVGQPTTLLLNCVYYVLHYCVRKGFDLFN